MPCASRAFPNYLVELKRNCSVYSAHVQNRHCGAVALQGYVEYFVQPMRTSQAAWNIARLGTIEFNGDVVVGNVHWVSSSDSSEEDRTIRKYHMTRVLCRFTYGRRYKDFVIAREVRSFRECFQAGREAFLKECKELPQARNNSPSLVNEEIQDRTAQNR